MPVFQIWRHPPRRLPARGSCDRHRHVVPRDLRRFGSEPALVLPAAADGLFRRRHLEPDGDRRHLLRQGLPGPVGGLPRRADLLGRHPLGAEDAAGPSGRSHLALEGAAGVARRGADRDQHRHHVRPDRAYRGDDGDHARRRLVRAGRPAGAQRLRRAGRGRRCDDGRGCARLRRARQQTGRGRRQGDAHHHADAGPLRHHQRHGGGGVRQHRDVRGRRDPGAGANGRCLRRHLPAGADHSRGLRCRRDRAR